MVHYSLLFISILKLTILYMKNRAELDFHKSKLFSNWYTSFFKSKFFKKFLLECLFSCFVPNFIFRNMRTYSVYIKHDE